MHSQFRTRDSIPLHSSTVSSNWCHGRNHFGCAWNPYHPLSLLINPMRSQSNSIPRLPIDLLVVIELRNQDRIIPMPVDSTQSSIPSLRRTGQSRALECSTSGHFVVSPIVLFFRLNVFVLDGKRKVKSFLFCFLCVVFTPSQSCRGRRSGCAGSRGEPVPDAVGCAVPPTSARCPPVAPAKPRAYGGCPQ